MVKLSILPSTGLKNANKLVIQVIGTNLFILKLGKHFSPILPVMKKNVIYLYKIILNETLVVPIEVHYVIMTNGWRNDSKV
jgi:hypothetical protein